MNIIEAIDRTAEFVQTAQENAEGGHDWWHTYRVWQNAKTIAAHIPIADTGLVELAALLHDIADSKFHNGDEEIGAQTAAKFLAGLQLDKPLINEVCQIIRHMSFKGGKEIASYSSVEMQIVQDADRLDALGAIGIARAFSYGGFKKRKMYDPNIPPDLTMDKETYKKSNAPTINHFYEKLLLLKDLMNTAKGKQMAEERHSFLEVYLAQFYKEWNGQ